MIVPHRYLCTLYYNNIAEHFDKHTHPKCFLAFYFLRQYKPQVYAELRAMHIKYCAKTEPKMSG